METLVPFVLFFQTSNLRAELYRSVDAWSWNKQHGSNGYVDTDITASATANG